MKKPELFKVFGEKNESGERVKRPWTWGERVKRPWTWGGKPMQVEIEKDGVKTTEEIQTNCVWKAAAEALGTVAVLAGGIFVGSKICNKDDSEE